MLEAWDGFRWSETWQLLTCVMRSLDSCSCMVPAALEEAEEIQNDESLTTTINPQGKP